MSLERFPPGSIVVDSDTPPEERGTAIVVQTVNERADAYQIEDMATAVAALPGNEAYPDDDPVVEVVFEGWLDSNVPNWRGMVVDGVNIDGVTFAEILEEYAESWGVEIRDYAYPASRLESRRYCPEHYMRAEYRTDVPGEPGIWECPLEACGMPPIARRAGQPLNAARENPRPSDSWVSPEPTDADDTLTFGSPPTGTGTGAGTGTDSENEEVSGEGGTGA